eukprot:scaffold4521_cov388-Prasinococcus_capsulatus_cf.AAC.6
MHAGRQGGALAAFEKVRVAGAPRHAMRGLLPRQALHAPGARGAWRTHAMCRLARAPVRARRRVRAVAVVGERALGLGLPLRCSAALRANDGRIPYLRGREGACVQHSAWCDPSQHSRQ